MTHAAEAWWYFWTVCIVLAGTSFALIALMVLVKGVGDLRRMLRRLSQSGDRTE